MILCTHLHTILVYNIINADVAYWRMQPALLPGQALWLNMAVILQGIHPL
jgi:hypothetical protein